MTPTPSLWAKHSWFIVLAMSAIAMVTLIVFGQLVNFQLLNHDDPYFVTLNPHVTGGLNAENIRWAFTTQEMGIWHPLTWMSYQLETTLFGADSPGPRHAVNLGLHLLSAMVLFMFCLRLTGAGWASLLVAILFAIHPQHVQPVAWVAERKEVSAALFSLLSLYFYAACRVHRNGRPIYALSLLAFGLALLCKPSAAPLPLILVLIDFFYRGAENSPSVALSIPRAMKPGLLTDLFRNKLPFFLLGAVAGAITIYIKKTGPWAGWEEVLPLGRRLLLMPIGMLHYLKKLFVPWPNQFWIEPPDGMPYVESLLSLGVLLALGFLVWRLRSRCPELLFGALWFVVMWLPVSGIILVSKHYVADRYTYLPYIGCFFGLAFLARALAGSSGLALRAGLVLCVVAVFASGVLAYRQTGYWRDSATFFQREIELNPLNATAQRRLGEALLGEGKFEQSLARLEAAIELNENEPLVYALKADALHQLGRMDEAMAAYRDEIEHDSDRSYPFVVLGRLLVDKGAAAEGMKVLEQGLRQFPSDVYLLAHMAHTYGFTLKQPEQAVSHYQRVLRQDPANTHALYGLGVLYLRGGEIDKGKDMLARLLAIDPENEAARKTLQAAADIE